MADKDTEPRNRNAEFRKNVLGGLGNRIRLRENKQSLRVVDAATKVAFTGIRSSHKRKKIFRETAATTKKQKDGWIVNDNNASFLFLSSTRRLQDNTRVFARYGTIPYYYYGRGVSEPWRYFDPYRDSCSNRYNIMMVYRIVPYEPFVQQLWYGNSYHTIPFVPYIINIYMVWHWCHNSRGDVPRKRPRASLG